MNINIWKIVRYGIVAAGLALLFWIYQPAKYLPPSVKEAIVLATTKKPETLTELYFQDHLGLPSRVTTDQQYSFAFTIHNLEHQDMDYPYEIYILQGQEKQYLDKNSVSVKENETITIQQAFILSEPLTRAKVVVELIDKQSLKLGEPVPSGKVGINNTDNNQKIDFWVEKE
jgi:hypothetical protein